MSAPPTAERRPGRGSGSSASGLTRPLHDTPRGHVRPATPPYIHATDTAVVTAKSGRTSQVLVVRCTHCGPEVFHLHRAPLDFSQGKRTCPTTRCGYVVISGVLGIIRGAA